MKLKLLKLITWLMMVCIGLFIFHQTLMAYSLNEIKGFIVTYQSPLLIAYAVLISFRGVLFMPTMPFILIMASTLSPVLMFVVTLTASCISAWVVCLAVDFIKLNQHLHRFPTRSTNKATQAINDYGLYAVVGWAFFPFVFTEIIVYLARAVGLCRKKIVGAVAIGEGGLILLLILATELFQSLLDISAF